MARLLSGVLATALLLSASALLAAPDAPQAAGLAIVLDIRGAIGPATAEYIHDGLAAARQRGARAVVLRIDTPGGLSSSMREIIGDILESSVPVIAYVTPSGARAASAGTYILYASHLAAMAPSTHLGAATPVPLGGGLFGGAPKEDKKDFKTPATAEEAKAVNDAVAYIRSLAQLRGRNAEWAEKAVREAATLTDSEAQALDVIDISATDLTDLLRQADGRSVKLGRSEARLATRGLVPAILEPDWRNRFIATITDPNIAYLLLLAGVYGILFEFFNPGAVLPGVIGGIALLIAAYALNLLPINYAGAGLLLLGIAMMVGEAFAPSGALAVGGIIAFAVGSLFLFPGPVPGFSLSGAVVAAATLCSAAILLLAFAAIWRSRRRAVVIGDAALVGSAGEVVRWRDTEGEVQVRGERWRAISATPLAPGQRVRVVARRDLTLEIAPESNASPQA
ncbi:MAG: nodulation protein NfeD [Pseudolabrys sp.]|nr:nodulation protein NfeD [Pseudolabrys sp.]